MLPCLCVESVGFVVKATDVYDVTGNYWAQYIPAPSVVLRFWLPGKRLGRIRCCCRRFQYRLSHLHRQTRHVHIVRGLWRSSVLQRPCPRLMRRCCYRSCRVNHVVRDKGQTSSRVACCVIPFLGACCGVKSVNVAVEPT